MQLRSLPPASKQQACHRDLVNKYVLFVFRIFICVPSFRKLLCFVEFIIHMSSFSASHRTKTERTHGRRCNTTIGVVGTKQNIDCNIRLNTSRVVEGNLGCCFFVCTAKNMHARMYKMRLSVLWFQTHIDMLVADYL